MKILKNGYIQKCFMYKIFKTNDCENKYISSICDVLVLLEVFLEVSARSSTKLIQTKPP